MQDEFSLKQFLNKYWKLFVLISILMVFYFLFFILIGTVIFIKIILNLFGNT